MQLVLYTRLSKYIAHRHGHFQPTPLIFNMHQFVIYSFVTLSVVCSRRNESVQIQLTNIITNIQLITFLVEYKVCTANDVKETI